MRADTSLCECSPLINVLSNRLPSEREDACVQGLALLPNSGAAVAAKQFVQKLTLYHCFGPPTSRNSLFWRTLVLPAPQNNSCKNSLFIIVLDRLRQETRPFCRILVPHAPQNNSCKNSLFIIVLDSPAGKLPQGPRENFLKECLPLRLLQKAAAGVRNGRTRKAKTQIRVINRLTRANLQSSICIFQFAIPSAILGCTP